MQASMPTDNAPSLLFLHWAIAHNGTQPSHAPPMSASLPSHPPSAAMLPAERQASAGLALVFALRMLGLFLVVPVLSLEARGYSAGTGWWRDAQGGVNALGVGLAMGVYGLTQALLQLPLGWASDRFGRKRIIALGLLVFVAGSVVAALATSINGLIVGRALQGAGAVSAAVTALLADLTRDAVRTKAMAIIGGSIGLVFSLALVAAPLLNAWVGLPGIFWLMGALALAACGVVYAVVPAEPPRPPAAQQPHAWALVLRHPALLRLNLGVFVLHAVQLAMWMVVPRLLEQGGVNKAQHWQVYLPAVLGSFVLMGAVLFPMERRGKLKPVFLTAIALVALVQAALGGLSASAAAGMPPSPWLMGITLLVFFTGFNILEASQPSLVSRQTPPQARGIALGIYNTTQSLGLFAGGAVGGILAKHAAGTVLFGATAACTLLWLAVAWGMQTPASADGSASSPLP